MPSYSIEELLDRIQRLGSAQVQAIKDAVYLGMTPTIATECEYRQEQISQLVDRLAALRKETRGGAAGNWLEIF
jgi:hypothetical protein